MGQPGDQTEVKCLCGLALHIRISSPFVRDLRIEDDHADSNLFYKDLSSGCTRIVAPRLVGQMSTSQVRGSVLRLLGMGGAFARFLASVSDAVNHRHVGKHGNQP